MASAYTLNIFVVNNDPTCSSTTIQSQITTTACSETYLVKISSQSNALGPFAVYSGSTGTTAIYSAATRTQMVAGLPITVLNTDPTCLTTPTPTPTITVTPTNTVTPTPTITQTPGGSATPTPSITATPTVTPTVTPTITTTPSVTPTVTPTPSTAAFSAYIFPEPLDATSQADLGQYLFDNGASWFGYSNSGGIPSGPTYATDLATYVQYSGWSGSAGNFITNVSTINSPIRQSSGSGTDSYGCTQNQYVFGTIEINTTMVNPNEQYAYTIWIPLAGVGGTMNNMTVDAGRSSSCSVSIVDNGIPDATNAAINVTVPSGSVIPSGTYRVLWLPNILGYPPLGPVPILNSSIFIKGDTKI